MSADLEVLDPRYDSQPACWNRLRANGLRADWSWPALTAQAWCSRSPVLITILREGGELLGVVCASWAGLPVRRHAFVSTGRARWAGILHVQSPGTAAVPGWWIADEVPVRDLLRCYIKGMRRELGAGLRGVLVRHLSEPDLPALSGRIRWVRPTDSLGLIPTHSWETPEQWLATLSRNRRKNLRKITRMVDADPSIEVLFGPAADADPVEVAALLRHNERKYPRLLGPLPQHAGYLEALFGQPDVLTIRYRDRDRGRLLAVVSILDHPLLPITRHWSALPIELGGRSQLYFHYYVLAVSWSLRTGRPRIAIGKGKPELKRTLGATLLPQFAAAVPVW